MEHTSTQQAQKTKEQTDEGIMYVDFLFFKVDTAFRRLPAKERQEATQAFQKFLETYDTTVKVRVYSTLGYRPEVDFLLWAITEDLEKVQTFVKHVYETTFGKYLTLVYSFVALKRPSPYALPHKQAFEKDDPPKKYLFVYPFVKSRDWYLLPFEKRKAIMDDHLKIGHQYPSVRLNTTYAFGLGDQDFVLAFEADNPFDFESLVQRLRETEGSRYTVRDTPMIVATSQSIKTLLEGLGL